VSPFSVTTTEWLEDRTLLTTLYVDTTFGQLPLGADPDGSGPATGIGVDAFGSIQAAIDASQAGDTIAIAPGTYAESLIIRHSLTLDGADAGGVILAPVSGNGLTISGIAGVVVNDMQIRAAGGHGLLAQASAGQVATLRLDRVQSVGAGQDAFSIRAENGGRVQLIGNAVSGSSAGRDGLHIESVSGLVDVQFANTGSFRAAVRDAVYAEIIGGSANDFRLQIAGAGADFTQAGRDGVHLEFTNFSNLQSTGQNFMFDRLDFSRAANNGFTLVGKGDHVSGQTTFRGLVLDSNFNNAGRDAFNVSLSGNNPASFVRFENSMMRQAGRDAVSITATNQSLLKVDIIDGNLTGSRGKNVSIVQDRESRVDIFIDPTPLDRGFQFEGKDGTVLNAHILDSPLSTAKLPAQYGIFGTLVGGATMNLKVENSIIQNAVLDGVNVSATEGSTFNATFIQSKIENSGRRGVFLSLDKSSKAVVNFTQGSTITGSKSSNVVIQANNGGTARVNFDAVSGNLSGAGIDGIFAQSVGSAASVDVTFLGPANLNNAKRDALSLNSQDGGRVNISARNGLSLNNAGDNAVSIYGSGANVTLSAKNVVMDNAGGNAYQAFVGNQSRVVTLLENVSSINKAGGDAIAYNVSNSFLSINVSGTALDPVNLDMAGGSGLDGIATNGASTVVKLNHFTIDGAKEDAFRLNLNNATMLTSTLDNGRISNSGQSGAPSSGVAINAVNNAQIGTRGTPAFGLSLTNVVIDNTAGFPKSQDFGLNVSADANAFVRMRMTGGEISRNSGHGIFAFANPDLSAKDNALIDLNFNQVNVVANEGDGVNLIARNGNNSLGNTTSGINFTFALAEITLNGNGNIGDGLGDGIDASAIGDPLGVAGNTTVCLNLTNANVYNNEEQQFRLTAIDRGEIKQQFGGGTFSGPVVICADGVGSSASLGLNNVRIIPSKDNFNKANDAAIIICAKNGGIASGNFSNMNTANGSAVSGHGAQAVVFIAETAGTILANFTSVDMVGNLANPAIVRDSVTGLPVTAAFQGVVRDAGSNATVNLTNVRISGHSKNGFEVNVSKGGVFNSKINSLTLENNNASLGEGEFDLRVDGAGSQANVTVNGLFANNSKGFGANILATNGAKLTLPELKSTFAKNAAQEGLNIIVNTGAKLSGPLAISNSGFDSSKNGDGVNIELLGAAGAVQLSLTNVTANQARKGGVDIDIQSSAAGGKHNVLLNNVRADSAQGGRGLEITASNLAAGDHIDVAVTGGSTFNKALVTGVDIRLTGADGSTGKVDINSVSANDVANNLGFNLFFTGGIDITSASLANVSATKAGTTGVSILTSGATTSIAQILITGSTFADAGNGAGVSINLDQQNAPIDIEISSVNVQRAKTEPIFIQANKVTGGVSSLLLQNITGDGGQTSDGLSLTVLGMASTDVWNVTIDNVNFSNAKVHGLDLLFNGVAGSSVVLNADGITANKVGMTAVNVLLQNAVTAAINSLHNVTATGAGTLGLNVNVLQNTSLTNLVSMNANFSGAAGTGVNVMIDIQNVPVFISFTGLNADNAGGKGVDIELDTVTGGLSTVALTNVTARNALTGEGLDLDVLNLGLTDGVDIDIVNGDFSNAFLDAANILITGPTVNSTLDINGLTVSDASDDGLDLVLNGGAQVLMTQFDNVVAQNNDENGLKFSIVNGSSLQTVSATGSSITGNGAAGAGFDGIDVLVSGAGSKGVFNFANLTVSNSGGRGIDLDVTNKGQLTFNVTGGTVAKNGLEGIDLNVGVRDEFGSALIVTTPAAFTGTFSQVNVSNSGQNPVFTADGINVDIRGAGTQATVTFDNTSSNTNDQDGFDISVIGGAQATIGVNNGSAGTGNSGRGLSFYANGAGTVANFSSAPGAAGNNTFNNNKGGPGFLVTLENAVTANTLEINASASGNSGDGVRVIANDGSGVTINNFNVSGNSVQVNNNSSNGLFLDFKLVQGINNFGLQNLDVSGNSLDQVFVRFEGTTATPVVLGNFFLHNINVTGKGAGAGLNSDGIEVQLLNTQITNTSTAGTPPTNLAGFSVFNVHAQNNGGYGLNLIVNESVEVINTPGTTTAGITSGIVTQSEFNNNGRAGLHMLFAGDSKSNFEIYDNTAGFHDNTGRGVFIEVQDFANFTMTGNNPADPDPQAKSFYNNQIVNNGGIGFHLVASEPGDLNLTAADGNGPRFVLDLGDILRNPNVLTGNTDAAMAIELAGDATGAFTIRNSIHQSTVNGANVNYNGDGLAFRLANFSSLDSLNVDGASAGLSLNNNAGSGLVTSVTQSARLGTVSRMSVLNTTITGNGLHGIDIGRFDQGLYGPDAANNLIVIGLHGQGNTFNNNSGNGVNVLNANKPGLPVPLRIEITDNDFSANRDGILMTGRGNAQFVGRFSDNTFASHTRDGIEIVLENDAALGDPNIVSNPAGTPFIMDGNQITGSARHGIFFDTDFTNDTTPFGGSAFANVLIRDSLTDGTRTLIQNSGSDGIRVIDNSELVGGPIVARNTYTVQATDIRTSGRDGIRFDNASAGGTSGNNAGHALVVGDPTNVAAGNRDVIITGSTRDGIGVSVASTNGNTATLTVNRTEIGSAATPNQRDGLNVAVSGGGRLTTVMENVDLIFSGRHGMQFNVTSVQSNQGGAVTRTTMHNVNSSQNTERGLDVILRHDRILIGAASTSVWNIGTAARATDATATNRFNLNGREGIVFDMQGTSLDQDTVNVNGTTGVQTDINDDVFIAVNQGFIVPTVQHYSTTHPLAGLLGVGTGTTRIHFNTTLNLINGIVQSNGGFAGFEDGVALGVGFTTRLNATIAGIAFGGNIGDDLRIYAQRSGEFNPPNSVNNNPPALINGLPQNYRVHDPVAYADIVIGSYDSNADNVPDTTLGNTGDQITINTLGIPQTAVITNGGIFTNADPIKGNNRPVMLAGQLQIDTVFNTTAANDFFQGGVQQNMGNVFGGQVINGAFSGWVANPAQTWPIGAWPF